MGLFYQNGIDIHNTHFIINSYLFDMNNMTLRQIECFLEVCRDFNFTNAARRLNLAQPPLSRHIRELEMGLGCRLFQRSSRRVELTEAGLAFLEQTCTIPQLLNKAADAARRAEAGETTRIRIGFVSAILNNRLFEVFRLFRISHPSIRLDLTENSPKGLIEKVSQEDIDGAFLGVAVHSLPSQLEQFHWRSEPLMVCIPQDHRLAHKETISIRDLGDESFVNLSMQTAPSYRNFMEGLFQKFKVTVNTVQEVESVSALLSLVVAGSGFALMPKSAVVTAQDHIATRPITESEAVLKEVFVFRRSNRTDVEPLIDLLKGNGSK